MPDTKLNKQNLRDHLRKYGAVYVVLCVVAGVLTNLLWTMTTPILPHEQRILIYLADTYSDITPLEPLRAALLERARSVDPEIQDVDFESLIYSPEDYTGPMVLMARLTAGEGDLFLAGADAMTALVESGACLNLEPHRQDGWLDELEPVYVDLADPETGAISRIMAGLKLDTLNALLDLRVMQNSGACMALMVNSPNIDSTKAVAEALVEMLKEASPHA